MRAEFDDRPRGLALLVVSALVAALVFAGLLVGRSLSGQDTTVGSSEVRPVAAQQAGGAGDEVSGEDEVFGAAGLPETASAAGPETAPVVGVFEVFGGKNPFQRPLPVVAPPNTLPDQPGDPGGTTSTTIPDPDDPAASTTTTTQPETDPGRGRTVELTEIYDLEGGTVANLIVNGALYTGLAAGDTFADNFQVVSLSLADQCGEFLMGDVDFELCVGQSILK